MALEKGISGSRRRQLRPAPMSRSLERRRRERRGECASDEIVGERVATSAEDSGVGGGVPHRGASRSAALRLSWGPSRSGSRCAIAWCSRLPSCRGR